MMGHSHALSGVVGWMAIVPVVQGTEVLGVRFDLGPAEIVAGSLVCAGAALLPDLDHKNSTITTTYGWITQAIGAIFNWLFGGHRMGTHSLLFAALMGALTTGLALWSDLVVQIFVFLLVGIAFNGLGFGMDKNKVAAEVINAMGTAGICIALYANGTDYTWIGIAVAFGCLLHYVGDCVTDMGCPLAWPLSKHRVGSPLSFKADGAVERKVVTPLLSVGIVLLSVYLFPWQQMLPEY